MVFKLKYLFIGVLLSSTYVFAQSGLGTLKGKVKDGVSGAPLGMSKVVIIQNSAAKGGAQTDADGEFQINGIQPGSYNVKVTNMDGYQPYMIEAVSISPDKITFLDNIVLTKPGSTGSEKEKDLTEVKVVRYKVPLIDKDGGASGQKVTRQDISRMPVRSAAAIAQSVGGVNSDEGTGAISVRGSRSDGTYYYIDGIKVRGSSNLPKSALEEVSVITGGVPANYGDVTGGIIAITTRGPSATYFGSAEVVSSGIYIKGANPNGYDGKVFGLDKYG